MNEANVFIVTVPTPINEYKKPDLKPLKNACEIIGKALFERSKKEFQNTPFVIFESTVYPGTTEEICVPIIEETSGLKLNHNNKELCFYCGYSPERINLETLTIA